MALRDFTGAKQSALQNFANNVTQGNPNIIAESNIYKGGQMMPPRAAPNPMMDAQHRPVASHAELMKEFRANQKGPIPMPAPVHVQQRMNQQARVNEQLSKQFENMNVQQNAGPKGPMQAMRPPPPAQAAMMGYAPPAEMMANHFRMYENFAYGPPPMMQNQMAYPMPQQMQRPQAQHPQQPQQPKQESKENIDKTEEGISTNGESDMKDAATVENELKNLRPTASDKQAITDLFDSTQNDPKMQNSQFFNLLKEIRDKPTVADESKSPADQLNEEFKDWKNDHRLDNAHWDEYLKSINPVNPETVAKSNDPQYSFDANNHFIAPPQEAGQESQNQDTNKSDEHFKEGLRLMKEGNLNEAILAFEACVQIEESRSEAWRYLGICHADNENENSGIAAFLKCIENDPYDLDALLQLGVSYTNEIDPLRALKYLRSWIANHADYSVLNAKATNENVDEKQSPDASLMNHNSWMSSRREHTRIVELFNKALVINDKDADLHIVLGVLYNITSDYDKAEFHFKKAIQARPKDPSLWNKLGATQANGQRCPQAIKAYSRALQLKPNYVRALSNLGISFANQSMHREACQSYLASLERNPSADSVWDHLTMSLLHMNRSDLVSLCEKRDPKLFKNYFQF